MRTQIELADKLYRCQDAAKKLLGEDYKKRVQWYMDLLLRFCEKNKVETLEAAISIGNDEKIKNNGTALMLLMAAAVEIIEPSNT